MGSKGFAPIHKLIKEALPKHVLACKIEKQQPNGTVYTKAKYWISVSWVLNNQYFALKYLIFFDP